jgi:signal transduction histidine kinase
MSAVGASRPYGDHASPQDREQEAARLRHDLRQYVAAGLLLSDPSRDPADGGCDPSRRMVLINQQFLAIAELLNSDEDLANGPGVVNLTRLVAECADVVRQTHRVPVVTERMAKVLVTGDQAMLRRAVGNLLDNACRAAGVDGTVTMRIETTPDGRACVEVSDDGPGFGSVCSGTGLGLQVVAEAVRVCSGRLEIASGPTHGTTVRLFLPAGHRAVRSA